MASDQRDFVHMIPIMQNTSSDVESMEKRTMLQKMAAVISNQSVQIAPANIMLAI
jgi:hypothetical protein